MIRPLTQLYSEAVGTLDQWTVSEIVTRDQIRQAVQVYDPYQMHTSYALEHLLIHELREACHHVQEQGLTLADAQTELLILSAFQSDAGYQAEEIQDMSPTAIKRHLSSLDAAFNRLLHQLFLHQSQPDILCQRFMTILSGAVATKCAIRAKRLKEATLVHP
ncbi:hypothetical protein ASF99_04575 [Exiguobacterium sp. Leaf187]|uniref:Uncharacterized protein n=1 Tax=Exiguobacterium indicum TaxID=296995 RepID=A0A0V8GKD2_9BACL|nr:MULTISPECIES: hypothetical protein [Exiguobacterium]AHA31481.1 hypothetical protein U719_09960 [Exiguobacterium sp. MH3]KNH36235.1 hypothetical protein ACS74_04100 [Exiguobacterium acetylicum]KQS19167.1 hypothetical protein ASF99_04575 [Exiguobacterium sp. Leaf187]KSU50759.1 hypothetical protein AS033_05100 [Exiguobacterium enclense]KTR28417.1 hypothetical protein RSA11_01580 [Exiguobacterium indicum]